MSVIARRLIASASLAVIGFTASLVAVPHSYADGGLLSGGLTGAVTEVTNDLGDTVGSVLDDTGLNEVLEAEVGSEGGSGVLDASIDADLAGIEAGVAATVSGGGAVALDSSIEAETASVAAEAAAGGPSLLQAEAAASVAEDLTLELDTTALGAEGVLSASAAAAAGDLDVGASVGPDLGTVEVVLPSVPGADRVPAIPTTVPGIPAIVVPAPALPGPAAPASALETPSWGVTSAAATEATSAGTTSAAPPAPRQTKLRTIEFPPLPRPSISSIAGSVLPGANAMGPARTSGFDVRTTPWQPSGAMPARVRALPVPPPTPLETAAAGARNSGGVFDSLNDVFGNVAGLLGGAAAGSSNGAPAPGGGIAVAILAAILVLSARLLMSVQWAGRTGLPESPPSYVLVPPG